MIGSRFSRYSVRSLPECECNDSKDEYDEARLNAWFVPGERGREDEFSGCREEGRGLSSEAGDTGEEKTGEVDRSSTSDVWALSREAAKLLVMSGSETTAYEEFDDVTVEAEQVLWRLDILPLPRCSSCHCVLDVSP